MGGDQVHIRLKATYILEREIFLRWKYSKDGNLANTSYFVECPHHFPGPAAINRILPSKSRLQCAIKRASRKVYQ
jgi:hypothetical protein